MEKKQMREEKNKMEVQFSKDAVLQSRKYVAVRDLLSVVLEDGKVYSSTEIDNAIENFRKVW